MLNGSVRKMKNSLIGQNQKDKYFVESKLATKLSSKVVAASQDDIANILNTINSNNSTQDVIVENGVVKTVSKDSDSKATKLSDHIVAATYWYEKNPKAYKFEKDSLEEHRKAMGNQYFSYYEGKTNGKLYFVVRITLKIPKILPNFTTHEFIMLYSHNFLDADLGSWGGQGLRVYPFNPDEKYYYKNGEIFHHLLPKDENNRHYICRTAIRGAANTQAYNAYIAIEEILRWLFVFHTWKKTNIDIDIPK